MKFHQNTKSILSMSDISYEAFYEFLIYLYSDKVTFSSFFRETYEFALRFGILLVTEDYEGKSKNKTIQEDMVNLWKDPIGSDVTFITEDGKEIKCHKMICIRSEYFKVTRY